MIAGGWSKFRALTAEDKDVFERAMKGLVGVSYEPLLVSTQVVAGENFKYLCNATLVIQEPTTSHKMVQIFRSLENEVSITSITNAE